MGVGEENTARGESIEIRREGLRVPPEAADPIVQIIDREEQDVRRLLRRDGRRTTGDQDCREDDER